MSHRGLISDTDPWSKSKTQILIMKVDSVATGVTKQGWPACHVMHVMVPFRTRRLSISSLLPPLSLLALALCIFQISIKIKFQLCQNRWRQDFRTKPVAVLTVTVI